MNKKLMYLVLFHYFFLGVSFLSANRLKHFEVAIQRFAPQILLEFSGPLYFEKKVYPQKMQLDLIFPAISLKDFKNLNVVDEIYKLGKLIKNVELKYLSTPSPRVILSIYFVYNDILIRWNKLQYPERLIIDLFRKKDLEALQNKGNRLLQAANVNKNNIKELLNLKPTLCGKKNLRVLVDAGHGGVDPGAKGFFLLKEKDLALDIASRTKELLKKNGFKAFLTRNGDQTLSLKDRTELAGQLNADLFISIHINAVRNIERASGIESYFLKSKNIWPAIKSGGFLFVFNDNDKKLAKLTDLTLKNNINLSEKLATKIQDSIIKYLQFNKLPAVNRGVKQSTFRVLLRSEIPVALIEVGFLTNKREAKLLSTPAYRQLLANGIYNGIKGYINSVKSF